MCNAYYFYYTDVLGIDGTTMKSQITLDEMQSVPNGRTVSVSMIENKKIYKNIYFRLRFGLANASVVCVGNF